MGKDVVLYDDQVEVLEQVRQAFREGHRSVMLYAPCGAGKCLGRGTPVLRYDGTVVPVEAVQPGDQLIGPDGKPRNVLSTTQGFGKLYRILPTKGDPYVVNADHILSLRRTGKDRLTLADGTVIEHDADIVNVCVEVLAASGPTARAQLKGWRAPAVAFKPVRRGELDPYWLGAWLGDGRSDGTVLCKPLCNMIRWCMEHAQARGHTVVNYEKREGSCPAWGISGSGGIGRNEYLNGLRAHNLLGNKHIPAAYKYGSITTRRRLLAGLMDSDGSVSNSGYDWISSDSKLANDVAFVARSLGLSAYVSECVKRIKSIGFEGTYWRVSISGECDAIPCLDKKAPPRRQIKRTGVHGIQIDAAGDGDYFGFALDGDRLFLLGDFTVTHNTEIAISMLAATAAKQNRGAMILDRIVLCNQTSERLQKYSIDHGVLQAGHWRWRPYERIQVCSAQTLEKRGSMPGMTLAIVDEAHAQRKQTTEFIRNNIKPVEADAGPDAAGGLRVIGLSGSPFTTGLAKTYTKVVTATTTAKLVDAGRLVPLRVFICKEVDMSGEKKVGGEWTIPSAEKKGMEITGDVVTEWQKKTMELFGRPRKTIVFCASVAHGADLAKKFGEAGFNFVPISYKDTNEFKMDAIEDFKRPDTEIHGLIACDILTKGFDCVDVMIGVSARPFSKSFSSHVQQVGRVMRAADPAEFPEAAKTFGVWIDHSGNWIRFAEDWGALYHDGVTELKDGAEKSKKEKTDEQKAAAKCPRCKALWVGRTNKCIACGYERPLANVHFNERGEMIEWNVQQAKVDLGEQMRWYKELRTIARERGQSDGLVAHRFKDRFGKFPPWKWQDWQYEPVPVSREVEGFNASRRIAWAKANKVGFTS